MLENKVFVKMAGMAPLFAIDMMMAFMFVWSVKSIRVITAHVVLGLNMKGDAAFEFFIRSFFTICNTFMFTCFGKKLANGGEFNPIVFFTSAFNGTFTQFLSNLPRIPFQVLGSIVGVTLIIETFPADEWRGPSLATNFKIGAVTEGLLTLLQVLFKPGLERIINGSFYEKTWYISIFKFALHTLGSDLTGGCMNPTAVVGWAYASGVYKTKEHIIVYWFAPIGAALLASCTLTLLTPEKKKKID